MKKLLSAILCMVMLVSSFTAFATLTTEAASDKVTETLSLSYDFEGGTADSALDADFLTPESTAWYTASVTEGFTFAADPANAENTVVKGNGAITFADTDGALVGKRFSTEMKLYVETMPTDSIALMSWNTGSDVQLAGLTSAGVLQVGTTATSITLNASEWNTVRADVYVSYGNPLVWFVSLWVNGKYIAQQSIATATASSSVSILSSGYGYVAYLDDISVTQYNAAKFDEVLSFEEFTSNTTMKQEAWSALLYPNAYARSRYNFKAVANPDDSTDMVAYRSSGTEGGYIMIFDPDHRLPTHSFIMAADFRFAMFPVDGSGNSKNLTLLTYIQNSKFFFPLKIDGSGALLDHNNSPIGKTVALNEWFSAAVHFNVSNATYDIYIDGEYVHSGDISTNISATTTASQVRVLNADASIKMQVYVDDVAVYEQEFVADPIVNDTIWDVNFDGFTKDTNMTMDNWNSTTDVASCIYNPLGGNAKIVEYGDGNALKVSNMTSNLAMNLTAGNGGYDPLKNSKLKINFDFTLDTEETTEATHWLLKWRRFTDAAQNATTVEIFGINKDEKAVFLTDSYVLDFTFEKGKTYNIEITLNGMTNSASLKVDDTVLVSERPVSTTAKSLDVEGGAYFLDDAGIKRYMPYTGIYKEFATDIYGNVLVGADGSNILVDRFVKNYTHGPDMLRLFQATKSSASGMVYYIDNFKVVREADAPVFSTDFTGYSKTGGKPTTANTDSLINMNNNTWWVNNTDGTEHPKLGNSGYLSFSDKNLIFNGKDYVVEADLTLHNMVDATTDTTIFSYVWTRVNSTSSKYAYFIKVDKNGTLYASLSDGTAQKLTTVDKNTKFNIRLEFHGTGTHGWDSYDVYVNGSIVGENLSFKKDTSWGTIGTSTFRFRGPSNGGYLYINSVKFGFPEVEIEDLVLDFEDDSVTNEAIGRVTWKYPALGATRTDTDGNTVATAEVLGESGSKYLRINHEKLTGEMEAYFDVPYGEVIHEDAFLIETSVRYTSANSFDLPIATLYDPADASYSPLVSVNGYTNKLYINLRGMNYDLVDKAGTALIAPKVTDDSFVDVAILADGVGKTYSIYVGGVLAYYSYGDQVLPCAELPMHTLAYEAGAESEKFVRFFEMGLKPECYALLDVDSVAVISLANGVAAEAIGTQTRTVLGTATFDVRFVAGIDTLYGNAVGFEITAEYTDANGSYVKNSEVSSNLVFDKIAENDVYISAEKLDSQYLATVEVCGVPTDVSVKFTVKPFVARAGVRSYGESYSVTYVNGVYTE